MSRNVQFIYRSETLATVLMLILLAIIVQLVSYAAPNLVHASPGTNIWMAERLAVGAYFILMGMVIVTARAFVAHTAPALMRFASHPGWLFVTAGIGLDVILLVLTRYQVSGASAAYLVLAVCALLQIFLYFSARRAQPN